jgi:hypothetical protein
MAGLLSTSQKVWGGCFKQIYFIFKAKEIIHKVTNMSTQNSQYDDIEKYTPRNVHRYQYIIATMFRKGPTMSVRQLCYLFVYLTILPLCRTWVSHGSRYEKFYLLGHNSVYSIKKSTDVLKEDVSSIIWQKNKPSSSACYLLQNVFLLGLFF